ncbi:MAG: RHS repeat-associated core domain-containing protein, partial [Endozoicomonadaceae bacterium]|nr:RHS repeat-associated core domain-containing protein [Endozoicomonadaceae bacterium]
LNKQLLSRWQFGYSPDNNIVTLRQQAENHQEAVLNYQYDRLDNLVSMHCNGSSGLPLCPRDTAFTGSGLSKAPVITSQSYTFTPLNRLSQVKEVLQNTATQQTLKKTVTHDYNNIKVPLRLQQTETQWNQQTPVIQHLYYDNTGNMTIDGEGNQITYNIFSQITRVIKPNGEQSQYVYDGSGLERLEENASGRYYLFYSGNKLINEKVITTASESHIVGYYGVARTIDNILHEYTEQNYKHDIVGILTKKTRDNLHPYQLAQRNVYSPYGMVWHNQPVSAVLKVKNFFGFDGQRTDPSTGWQFLGSGHRTYNPQQRYFVSEDPVGNGYAFASNNPIMKTDPSGNISKRTMTAFRVLRYIGTFGFGAIKSFNHVPGLIVGTILMCAASFVTVIPAMVICGMLEGIQGYFGFMLVSATLSGIDIAFDEKGLNIATSVVGALQFITVVMSTMVIIPQIYNYYYPAEQMMAGLTNEVSSAGRVAETASMLEESPPRYESLNFENTDQSMNQVENRQLDQDIEVFATNRDSHSPDITTDNGMKESSVGDDEHMYRGITIASCAATLRDNPVSDTVFDEFINTQAEFPSAAYRNAFKDLMTSLDIHSTTAEKGVVSLYDLFPSTEEGATIVVGKDDIGIILVNSNKFTPYMIINRSLNSPPYSYDEVMQPFHDS